LFSALRAVKHFFPVLLEDLVDAEGGVAIMARRDFRQEIRQL